MSALFSGKSKLHRQHNGCERLIEIPVAREGEVFRLQAVQLSGRPVRAWKIDGTVQGRIVDVRRIKDLKTGILMRLSNEIHYLVCEAADQPCEKRTLIGIGRGSHVPIFKDRKPTPISREERGP